MIRGSSTALLGLASCVLGHAQLSYTTQEFRYPGALPSWSSNALCINDGGDIAGTAEQPDGRSMPHLWLSTGINTGIFLPNGSLGGKCTSINEGSVAVGTYVPSSERTAGFKFTDSKFLDIGTLPGFEVGTSATGINEVGTICGYARAAGNQDHAILWNKGIFIDLHERSIGCTATEAFGINDAHDVVGGGRFENKSRAMAWWSDNSFEILPGLPSNLVLDCAFAVNRKGEITGRSFIDPLGHRPVIWRRNQAPMNLGLPPGKDSAIATAINDLAQVVGYADTSNSSIPTTAFLASETLGNLDLRALAGMAAWKDLFAYGINNKGVIVGQGTFEYSFGQFRRTAFKLTPGSTIAAPSSYTVQLGKHQSGNVQSLASQDSNALRVCRFLVPSSTVAPVTVQLDGTLPFLPMNLWLNAVAKTDAAGSFSITADLWDWQARQYDAQDEAISTLNTQYSNVESIAKGDITRYVGNANAVRARLRVKPTGPTASLAWCVDFDQAVWNAVPRP